MCLAHPEPSSWKDLKVGSDSTTESLEHLKAAAIGLHLGCEDTETRFLTGVPMHGYSVALGFLTIWPPRDSQTPRLAGQLLERMSW